MSENGIKLRQENVYTDRKSIRLQGYDYSLSGGYFVSIITHKRTKFFGKIVGEEIKLNAAGKMVQKEWLLLADRFPSLILDEFIVLPDHFHGILFLTYSEGQRGIPEGATTRVAHTEEARRSTNKITTLKLGQIIGAFKSITTNNYIHGVNDKGWKPFDKKIWHRNYHDRIIRNEKELKNIRNYIRNNTFQRNNDTYKVFPYG